MVRHVVGCHRDHVVWWCVFFFLMLMLVSMMNVVVVDRFYIALFSAVEQIDCACMRFYMSE